jgi:hypothetical protein
VFDADGGQFGAPQRAGEARQKEGAVAQAGPVVADRHHDLREHGDRRGGLFDRPLAWRADEQKSMHRELLGLMRSLFGDLLLRTVLKDSTEIDNTSARLMTVYELDHPVTSRETYKSCMTYRNAVNADRDADPARLAEPRRAAAHRRRARALQTCNSILTY